jgi:hypothetical protein
LGIVIGVEEIRTFFKNVSSRNYCRKGSEVINTDNIEIYITGSKNKTVLEDGCLVKGMFSVYLEDGMYFSMFVYKIEEMS